MKERPILFNTEMVQAILAGRKTQTRRIANVSHERGMKGLVVRGKTAVSSIHFRPGLDDCCPFGERGDRLWVRETYGLEVRNYAGGAGEFRVFKASKPDAVYCIAACGKSIPMKWKPSIHMPRSACRIILEITGLRVERLNDITNADCKSEGYPADREADGGSMDPFLWFRDLWNKTGGNFNSNPWVWVIEFKVLTTNGVIREVAA